MSDELRCGRCHRRLIDYRNRIETGSVLISVQCPKCGAPNTLKLTESAAERRIAETSEHGA